MRLRSHPAAGLRGRATVPGDKSVSHRALLFGALAVGESRITGLLEGADVLATAEALRALGVELEREGEGRWRVHGRGVGGLAEPDRPLDLGNSGTAARLLLGVLAGHPFTTFLSGDESLRARPMARVIEPLCRMGATVLARSGRCQLGRGAAPPRPALHHRIDGRRAGRAGDRIAVHVVEPRTTIEADPLGTPLGFGHAVHSAKSGRLRG